MKYKDFFEAYPWGGFDAPNPDDIDSGADDSTHTSTGIDKSQLTEKDGPCWAGYEMVGTKMKNGKEVPNCVPIDEERNLHEENHEEIDEYCSACLADYMKEHAGMLEEAEYQGRKVPIGKPMRGDVKKFKVYVKDPSTGNVKKVNFGDKTMKIKKSNPARRKSFRARHNCDNPGPRTKARYWSCRKW